MSVKDESETCLSLRAETWDQNETLIACPTIFDGFLCWNRTALNTTVSRYCPTVKGAAVTSQATRLCGMDGQWLGRDGLGSDKGWTNYSTCFTPEIREIIRQLGNQDEAQTKLNIAFNTRVYVEFVGLTLSLTALVLSLSIFHKFRTLRNSRTRLHRHLFVAMVIQVAIRLTLYIDQAITRASYPSNSLEPLSQDNLRGIDNTPILCETGYIVLEYSRTCTFFWALVEGIYLHNLTVNVFEERLSPLIYSIVGWIIPIPLTITWALVTAINYGTATCWWGYNFTLYFWILEGPRLAVLFVNLAFLLNILRVLVTKLRRSNSSETHQIRKAVKAALLLLPLLGLTNLVNMLDAPLEKSAWIFGLWSYSTHLLTSCQGFILACLYCFCNGEVQLAIKKYVRTKMLGRNIVRLPSTSVRMSLLNNSTLREGKTGSVVHGNHVRVVVKKTSTTQFQDTRPKTNHLKRNNNNRQDNGDPGTCSPNDRTSTTENVASSQRIEKLSTRIQHLFGPNENPLVDKEVGMKGTHYYKNNQSEIRVVQVDVDSSESTPQECAEILEDSSSNEEYIDACPV